MCTCGTELETTEHFFLRCPFYSTQRLEIFENLKRVDSIFFNLNEKHQVNSLLSGSQTNDSKCANQNILKFVITYIKPITRSDRSLISNKWKLYFCYSYNIDLCVNMSCKLHMYLYLANFNLLIIPICSNF